MNQTDTKFILAQKFTFDPNNNSLMDLSSDSEVIRLGSNESRILLMLSENPNKIISRDELHEFVWRDQGFQVDDSSLTQAISTLRKMLGDSTKQPQFVKTVPKRGYKFIATVEALDEDSSEESMERSEADIQTAISAASSASTIKTEEKPASEPAGEKVRYTTKFAYKFVYLIALLLPAFVYLSADPVRSKMKVIDNVRGVPIETTIGHPPLNSWQDTVKRCIDTYLENHPGERKPAEIIITAGPRNNIILNTIHAEEYSNDNSTIQLITDQRDIEQLCR
ncbi:transcriptional regulator [Vibrio sp. JC009]|uniref:winged helix-turn-helix domain-containing protein n=1 Tax=Vibrio sp. JC009 TaxID=2912314 RepID=UPI0023B1381F|nr:transcriptional regulator [Vibrio sp. JC009]WED20992.1 transcriptional regulator [Vibrio sp. JC009]